MKEGEQHRIGFMQGRLSPPVGGTIQSFPWETWRSEFEWGAQKGFPFLEWVFDTPRFQENPLWTAGGQALIRQAIAASGVTVDSVVGDYFMDHPLFQGTLTEKKSAQDSLFRLIDACSEVGIGILEIPIMESASLTLAEEEDQLFNCLMWARERSGPNGITFSLEMDLPPNKLACLLKRFQPLGVGVTFDMGNSAALGFDPQEEIPLLMPFLTSVHVKDRRRNGVSVPLGQGDVRLRTVFELLRRFGYSGRFILQTARTAGRDIEAACAYRDQVMELLRIESSLSGSV